MATKFSRFKEFRNYTMERPTLDRHIYEKLISNFDYDKFSSDFNSMVDSVTGSLFCVHTFGCLYFITYNVFEESDNKKIDLCVELINSHDRENVIIASNILFTINPKTI